MRDRSPNIIEVSRFGGCHSPLSITKDMLSPMMG
ncbi:hypothetical protein BH20CHL1_BH20CHL1_09400 [soil metagenome]